MIDLRLGDCIEILKTLPDNSVDSVVVDPPYHLTSIVKRFGKEGSAPAQFGTDGAYSRASKGFMGKEWDGGDIAFRTDVWSECLRVLKPGGYLLSFSAPRTYHRMAVAIEDAGFEIRDQIMWLFGSGFPKSHNIGKAIDKIEGNEREVVGDYETSIPQITPWKDVERFESKNQVTKGNSEWEGWGTALKPAHEPICMARKPLSEKSIAENVLRWGTGGINIDESRISVSNNEKVKTEGHIRKGNVIGDERTSVAAGQFGDGAFVAGTDLTNGRFPANIMFECICDETYTKPSPKSGHWSKTTTTGFGEFGNGSSTYEGVGEKESGNMIIHTNPNCPCYMLDEQSGVKKSIKRGEKYNKEYDNTNTATKLTPAKTEYTDGNTYADKGGASRFFYSAKVSKKERGEGNTHPTVKPIAVMEYLIKMVTPKGGTTLDCFMGSGSTGIAAKNLGMNFIGIEKEQEYMDIAKQRINYED